MQHTRFSYFFSQPHQPFFLLGIINAVMIMLLFIPSYRGLLSTDPLRLHSYGMLFAVFTNFFYGFTYTTYPRFSARPPIDPRRYLRVWLFNLMGSLSLYTSITLPEAFYGAVLFIVLSFAYTLRIFLPIYQKAPEPKRDQYWIIVALGMGALSNLLFLLAALPCNSCRPGIFSEYAIQVGIWLYLIFLPLVIAFRMIPFFSRVIGYTQSPLFLPVSFLLLLGHVLLSVSYPKGVFAIDLLLAIWTGKELLRIHLPFPNSEPLLWSLHLAMFWLPLGFFVGALTEFAEVWFGVPSFRLTLHLLVLGFLTTLLISFGTRVTLGHGGAPLRVDRRGIWILLMPQLVLAVRVLLSLTAGSGHLFPWFDISAVLWILLYIVWTSKYGSILILGRFTN